MTVYQAPAAEARPRVLASTVGLAETDWLALRRTGLGSSDAPAVVGLSPWASPLGVWLDKTGQAPDRPATEAMTLGTALEPVVADLVARREGRRVQRRRAILQHPTHDWMLANLDRRIRDDSGGWRTLEIKTTSAFQADAWADGPPTPVLLQCWHQLAVTGEPYQYAVALIGGQHLTPLFRVDADDAAVRALVEVEQRFWLDYVLAGRMPPLTGAGDEAEQLRTLWPESASGRRVELPAEAADWLQARADALHDRDLASARAEALTARLQALMGPAEEATLAGQPVIRWKSHTQAGFDLARFRAEHPDLAAQYARMDARRPFRILKGAEK